MAEHTVIVDKPTFGEAMAVMLGWGEKGAAVSWDGANSWRWLLATDPPSPGHKIIITAQEFWEINAGSPVDTIARLQPEIRERLESAI